jgi:DNA-binding transcriptional MerR regulator
MAGLTVRTLHYYDRIGLLPPSGRTAAGYRLYREPELLRLQQICFLRELDVPLDDIRAALDDPYFNHVEALLQHRQELLKRGERLSRLVETIDQTIARLTEGNMQITDDDLYAGFTQAQRVAYDREARERWGDEAVDNSTNRAKNLTKDHWAAYGVESKAVCEGLAAVADRDVSAPEVQALIARHYKLIELFYTPTAEVYAGLGQLYVQDDRFRANYDVYRPGMADFMAEAMAYYAEHTLQG